MATYCIGDIHACYNEFMKLLEVIKFDEKKDELLLTGDLIGRGPYPVETMHEIMRLGDRVHAVLGNHDINFLAVAHRIVMPRPKDNLEVILKSPLLDEITDYLIHLPLLYQHKEKQLVLVHAGIYPFWELSTAGHPGDLERRARGPYALALCLKRLHAHAPLLPLRPHGL